MISLGKVMPCKCYESICVSGNVRNDAVEKFIKLDMIPEQVEFLWSGKYSKTLDCIYGRDLSMKSSYANLKLSRLNCLSRNSRHSYVACLDCCDGYWQIFNNKLTVFARSTDLEVGGRIDLIIAECIASRLNAEKLEFIMANPHVYVNDEDKIKICKQLELP